MGIFREFPYSNFHDMNMDEIIKIVKNMLEEWAQYYAEWDAWMAEINDDWSNYQEVMTEAWENMQSFINNYFDNLNVQTEINNKITDMVRTGEFSQIVNPYVPPAVASWLAEHITTPETVVIDDTLSIEGAAADAKATGDAVAKLQNDIGNTYPITFTDELYVAKDDGSENYNALYSASNFIAINNLIGLKLTTAEWNDASGVCFYTTNDVSGFISGYNINTTGELDTVTLNVPANAKYLRFTCATAKKDGAVLSMIPMGSLVNELYNSSLTEKTSQFTPTWVYGKCVLADGEITDLAPYRYADYVIAEFDSITATETDPSGNAVAFLSRWTIDDHFIETIAVGSTTLQTKTAKYKNPNEKIRICVFSNDSTFNAVISDVNVPTFVKNAVNEISEANIENNNNSGHINISMFDTVGVCGDSYSTGTIFNGNTPVGEFSDISWGKVLSRLAGFNVTNYAKGGADTSIWLSDSACMPALLSDTPKKLYILCLGINDADAVTIGDISDIDDVSPYTNHPNTFYGNYGEIIHKIMEHAPNASIIISKTFLPNYPISRYYNYSSTAIEEIAAHFNIPYIDTINAPFLISQKYVSNVTSNKGHPTAPYYSGIADSMLKLLNKCMNDNISYFVHFNPTV